MPEKLPEICVLYIDLRAVFLWKIDFFATVLIIFFIKH